MDSTVDMRHSFDLTIRFKTATLEDRMLLCNALDGYELEKGIADQLVLDVVECQEEQILVRITPMRPLTYKDIARFIGGIVEFAGEQTNWRLDLVPAGIRWDVTKYGVPSERFDRSLLLSHPRRQQ